MQTCVFILQQARPCHPMTVNVAKVCSRKASFSDSSFGYSSWPYSSSCWSYSWQYVGRSITTHGIHWGACVRALPGFTLRNPGPERTHMWLTPCLARRQCGDLSLFVIFRLSFRVLSNDVTGNDIAVTSISHFPIIILLSYDTDFITCCSPGDVLAYIPCTGKYSHD